MTATHSSGPLFIFGQSPYGNEYNPQAGPSLFYQGAGVMDPRTPYTYIPGGRSDQPVLGWPGVTAIPVISQAPSTASATNIAAAQVPVAGTPLTLRSTTGAGITVGVSITRADTGVVVTGLLAIDGAAGTVQFGQGTGSGGPSGYWDPTKAISRALILTAVGNDSSATYVVRGYDIYGYPMTQTVTGPNATTGNTLKAFKYIASITPAGTLSGSNISVGTTDIIGLPLRADFFGEASIVYNNAVITANTGFVAAVTTSPATALTGDVRGTYLLPSASDGTKRLQISITPSIANMLPASGTGLVGVTQV